MSSIAASYKTDTGSKVLPGDKHGLPWEIWRIIMSYLSAEDLCRTSMVCKTWSDLVTSMDHTKWKELYLQCTSWRHPSWPLNLHKEPTSWRQAYKHQYIASYFWNHNYRKAENITCMSVFQRNRTRKTITVGIGMEHESLKSALGVANDYDRILVYPGIYDEQFEMSSKIPFEIVGCGELGSVILVVCIEQTAITGRVSNLVFRAPWFTNFILKVRSGYLQVDNCILEDGIVYVQNPGSVNMNFCTFRHATVILQHVNASIIQNCEFSQTDSAAITVEGYPKEDKNWTYASMISKIMSTCTLHQKPERQKSGETVPKSAISSTAISLSTATTKQKSTKLSCDTQQTSSGSDPKSHDIESRSCDACVHSKNGQLVPAAVGGAENHLVPKINPSFGSQPSTVSGIIDDNGAGQSVHSLSTCKSNALCVNKSDIKIKLNAQLVNGCTASVGSGEGADSLHHDSDKIARIHNFVSDCAKYSNTASSGESTLEGDFDTLSQSLSHGEKSKSDTQGRRSSYELGEAGVNDCDETGIIIPSLNLHLPELKEDVGGGDAGEGGVAVSADGDGTLRGRSLSSSEVSLHSASGSDIDEEEERRAFMSDSTSSSDEDSLAMSDNDSAFSSSEESVIMLTYPDRHQPRSLSAQKEYAEVASICSQNQSEHIDIIQDNDMRKILNEVRGCFIHRCRMTQSKGGLMVSLQAHAIILECEINSVGYGIRCIQNSRVVILKNEIHHCRTSGIFMRLAASGLITGNDIHSNCEAGVDIRKNADPIVQCNRIHHGKRSGVVVLGSGRGQIKHNDIYQNKEAGVYILYRGNPTVSHNQIYSGRAAGIAVNEGGRGYIHENIITGNQWGGIDIRHGGDPIIHKNTVCNGVSDGIVIGEGGRGIIDHNTITGNAGCGVWIMAANQPLIHGNEIHSNRDSGISLVNRICNAGCGVWIMAANQPLIHGNEIHSNRDSGISLVNRMDALHNNETMMVDRTDVRSEKSLAFSSLLNSEHQATKQRPVTIATVEYNKVFHNNGKGISVQFGDGVMVQFNTVHGNKGEGIMVDQSFPVVVRDNSVSYNTGLGVSVSSQGKAEIRGNGIYDNKDCGISCQNEAVIFENDIMGNGHGGILLKSNKSVKVKMNRIHSGREAAISMSGVIEGVIDDNKLYTNTSNAINADKNTNCMVLNNHTLAASHVKASDENDKTVQSTPEKTRWLLKDPPARPDFVAPLNPPSVPAHHVTTITKVTVPASNCEQGSKFCLIL